MTRPPFPLCWDIEDTWLLEKYSWHVNNSGYVSAGGTRLFHRMVMNAGPGQEIGHRNHNKLDCRKENLYLTTRAENQQLRWDVVPVNQRFSRLNKTGIVGVSWDTKTSKWRAYTSMPQKSLGFFGALLDACAARKSWENQHV